MKTEEQLLPKHVLDKAIHSGREYGWKQHDFVETVTAAQRVGLGTIGGQVQFVLHDGTCDLYWLHYYTTERQSGERWEAYCIRTANECLTKFDQLVATTDFIEEGVKHFDFLKNKASEGVDLSAYLTFILYFNDHETWLANP